MSRLILFIDPYFLYLRHCGTTRKYQLLNLLTLLLNKLLILLD